MAISYTNFLKKKAEGINYPDLLHDLVHISLNGLREMYLPSRLDFAAKKKLVKNRIILTGINDRYTLINLIGLHRASAHGFNIGIDLQKILKKQIKKCGSYNGAGEIGLLLWAAALIDPESIDHIFTKINFSSNIKNYGDYQNKLTTELSWLLTGILMASTFNQNFKDSVGDLDKKVYKLIRDNYGGKGIFMHQAEIGLSGLFRSNISSFADQVYPIYALTLFSQQKDNVEAMLVAKECAMKICELQGPNGEWYWHYDTTKGEVLGKYPIYSVHQDAMAPMALFAIQRASKINFEEYIYKGLNWLVDQKDVDADIINKEENLVWRAVAPNLTKRKVRSTLKHVGLLKKDKYSKLDIVEECWSYHLGWILYVFSGRLKVRHWREKRMPDKNIRLFNSNNN